MDLTHSLLGAVDFGLLPQQVVNGILLGSIYALIALGYTMVYGVLRLINFAHGEVFMLGAYVSLFVAWGLGFGPGPVSPDQTSNWVNLVIMLVASMGVCAAVGMFIEFFAYRPMRNQPRIASLITAIGVSLLLQYAGALFLPNSPPVPIREEVNPYRANVLDVPLKPKSADLLAQTKQAQVALDEAERTLKDTVAAEGIKSEFDLSPEGKKVRDARNAARTKATVTQNAYDQSGLSLRIPYGQLIMFLTSIGLMLILRHVVMNTAPGRAMRAVSLDYDSASLMGVNVGRIITLTFAIGSALAGAGAMMNATFLGTPLTTFFGMQPGVKAFVAAVLGGIGNIPGAVLGGLLMGIAETLVVWVGYGDYKDAIAFVILILVLLFRPGGLLGSAKVEKV
ncbi:MAG: branched-chain amino acid ABC transporter permease [Fimbriimonadaceae bacterium]|nr:branched-chain amino acid ABC transporter permease [Fimbriimonadaceae bacterium]